MSRSKLRSGYMRGKHGSDKRNPHHLDEMPKNRPSKYITTRCDWMKANWLQEPGSFGGHKTRRQGHRMVSGIVRQKIKEENRRRFKVNIKVHDGSTKWMARDYFYIPLADWETKKVNREAVFQIIYQHVTFPERIDGQGASKVFHDSVKKLYDDIREHYLEENFEGIVG